MASALEWTVMFSHRHLHAEGQTPLKVKVSDSHWHFDGWHDTGGDRPVTVPPNVSFNARQDSETRITGIRIAALYTFTGAHPYHYCRLLTSTYHEKVCSDLYRYPILSMMAYTPCISYSDNSRTIFRFPLREATCDGVQPSSFRTPTFAPCLRSASTISK